MLVKEQNVAMHHVLAKDSVRISRRVGEGSTQSSSTDAHFLGEKSALNFNSCTKFQTFSTSYPRSFRLIPTLAKELSK